MAPTRRPRPAFSPPRPGKSKSKTKPTSRRSTSDTTTKKKRGRPSTSTTSKRPRRTSPSPSAQDSDPEASPLRSDNSSHSQSQSPAHSPPSSPEPDHILVEPIPTSGNDTTIPLPLLQHILHQHFQHKAKTKMSADARQVFSAYIDTFVREAVIRCAYGRAEGEGGEGVSCGGDVRDGDRKIGADGWLEVGDLEKVGVQLVLDF